MLKQIVCQNQIIDYHKNFQGCYCKPGYMMMDKGCVPAKFGDGKHGIRKL